MPESSLPETTPESSLPETTTESSLPEKKVQFSYLGKYIFSFYHIYYQKIKIYNILGCFKDKAADRDFRFSYSSIPMSNEKCAIKCKSFGYKFFGIQKE